MLCSAAYTAFLPALGGRLHRLEIIGGLAKEDWTPAMLNGQLDHLTILALTDPAFAVVDQLPHTMPDVRILIASGYGDLLGIIDPFIWPALENLVHLDLTFQLCRGDDCPFLCLLPLLFFNLREVRFPFKSTRKESSLCCTRLRPSLPLLPTLSPIWTCTGSRSIFTTTSSSSVSLLCSLLSSLTIPSLACGSSRSPILLLPCSTAAIVPHRRTGRTRTMRRSTDSNPYRLESLEEDVVVPALELRGVWALMKLRMPYEGALTLSVTLDYCSCRCTDELNNESER